MDNFLKIASCLMTVILLTTQLLLASPYRSQMVDDTLNGRQIKTYETLIYKGSLMLNVIGRYETNSAAILINGKIQKIVDFFPIQVDLCDGDVLEVQLKRGSPAFYMYLTDIKGQIKIESQESSFLIDSGINYIVKAQRSAQNADD